MTKPLPDSFKQVFENSVNKPFNEFHITPKRSIKLNKDFFLAHKNNYRVFIHEEFDITFKELKKKLISQFLELGYSNIVIEQENIYLVAHEQNENSYISLLSTHKGEYIIEGIEIELINFLDELL